MIEAKDLQRNRWRRRSGPERRRIRLSTWLALLLCLLLAAGCRRVGGSSEVLILPQTGAVETSSPSASGSVQVPAVQTGQTPVRAQLIICEIKGQVEEPGVYDLAQGSRVSDLIRRSGGILPGGSVEWVNQARKLQDGEVLVIPPLGTSRADYEAMCLASPPPDNPTQGAGAGEPAPLVNINTATHSELESIPGIGPVTAQNILDHRTLNGPFNLLEDLKKVDRIGDKTFEKLKKYITVGP